MAARAKPQPPRIGYGPAPVLAIKLGRTARPLTLVGLPPPAAARCPRWGHRLLESSSDCLACRALWLWPRIDRARLRRAAPSVDRIARLVARSSGLDLDTIKGMLTRERAR